SITGGYVALVDAVNTLVKKGALRESPIHGQVAAVSVGIWSGMPVVDLDYAEDSEAETDMNVVMNNGGGFIEVQGTAEGHAFRRNVFVELWNLAANGIGELLAKQLEALTLASECSVCLARSPLPCASFSQPTIPASCANSVNCSRRSDSTCNRS